MLTCCAAAQAPHGVVWTGIRSRHVDASFVEAADRNVQVRAAPLREAGPLACAVSADRKEIERSASMQRRLPARAVPSRDAAAPAKCPLRIEPAPRMFQFRNVREPLGRAVSAARRCVRRTALCGRAWCAPCVSIRAASAIAAALSTAAASGGRTHLRRGQQNENRSHRHVPCRKHESPTCPRLRLAADRGDVARGLSFHPDRRVRSERARVTHEADGCRSAVGDDPQERSWPRVPPQPSFPRALRAPRARAPVVAARAVSRTRRRSVRVVQIGKPACAPPPAHRRARCARDPVARPIDPLPRWINC